MFHVLMFGIIFTSTLVLGIVGANRVHHRVSRLREESGAVRESRTRVVRTRSVVLLCVGFLMPLSLLVLPDRPVFIVLGLAVSIPMVIWGVLSAGELRQIRSMDNQVER